MKNPNPSMPIPQICPEGKKLIERCCDIANACGEISEEAYCVNELLCHIHALAEKYKVTVRYEKGKLSALHCVYRSVTQTVHVPWPVGSFTYFTALHEFGHAALNLNTGQNPDEILAEEKAAWNWASSHGIIPYRDDVSIYADVFLDQYRHRGSCNICGTWREVSLQNDPVAYEAAYKSMFGVE